MLISRLICSALLASLGPLAQAGLLDAFSERDTTSAMRQALGQGAEQAVSSLGRTDGFLSNQKVHIQLPEQLRRAEPALRLMGKGPMLDELETGLNRAAEQAVPLARKLLADAVSQMSVQDVKGVLTGGDDAATRYFESKTREALNTRFLPEVRKITGKLTLAQQYNQVATAASGMGLLKAQEASVESYVTARALDGLYLMIAEEERAIRSDPTRAAGQLVRQVFSVLGN
ncbi:MAG: hypothetical protein CGU28_14680 [Candidatus Dactylopiibacterium carminicum]|uniref:DUF4197 domain-containing protein n=1 Tax=Candidatus Dactylopiibacterium carminicum TaxID=857335 RepID=A0A272ENM4_9RHOO|nr:DUF4197 domain-containing protein [Candidatus Dactylopiibacterium carminicum]KAF7598106.1 DUF4197 domain-containing protein [Candidatus Dactylopiibacterium carminicum]PAS91724.1 MAG: hypothetical protein CGU29_14810 [Candidatus Dactylopiibacterium carminicum]PAS93864.1 MAG: hypothetical protein CGU28_14680 [Candidatus Dactylopiibacterium carminicum]PAS96622.1 MAG: hypothetical protein BSR46_15170 [Candidatus Dactylopiibacterium carminicum]